MIQFCERHPLSVSVEHDTAGWVKQIVERDIRHVEAGCSTPKCFTCQCFANSLWWALKGETSDYIDVRLREWHAAR